MMVKLKKFSLMLTPDLHASLQQNAESRGLTMNAVVIFALENHFKEMNFPLSKQEITVKNGSVDDADK